jgi:hypothetical protein
VVCSLGAIGILTKVQFSLVDQRYFETMQRIAKLKNLLTDIRQTSQAYDFWRIDWIPDTDEGLVWTAKRIEPAGVPEDGDYPVDQAQNILEAVFKLMDKFNSAGPLLDNPMRLLYNLLSVTYGEVVARGPLRNMLPVDRYSPLHVAMVEWSFDPVDLGHVLAHCRAYFERQGWNISSSLISCT